MDYLSEFKKELKGLKIKRSFGEDIEAEEVLLDAEKSADFAEQRIETPLRPRIFLLFFGLIVLALLMLAGRAGYLQILKDELYGKLAERNSLRAYPVMAPRGLIYSRDLEVLVNNMPSFDIFLLPQDLPKDKVERDTMIEQISFLLGLNPRDINQELVEFNFEKNQRILLVSDLEQEKILDLESRLQDFPALRLEKGVVRQYPFAETLSHILGYTGRVTKEEIESLPDNYEFSDRLGKSGLEAQYEDILKGQAGEQLAEIDAFGRQIKEMGVKEPIAGQNIVTSIDLGLQQKIFSELRGMAKNLNISRASAVAMDVQSGEILGLVSLPSFDNNLFEKNTDPGDLNKLYEDPSGPLFDRAIAGQYASGSTIKPMMAAAALQEKVVTPSTVIYDAGQITIVSQFNPSIVYNFPDWKAHGSVNLYSAIAQSCDVYFYTVGGGWGNIDGLGIDRIKKYLNLFGLGELTGIDLPGEKTGLVPDGEWKQKAKNESWFIGDTYHVSIGQGDLLVTPLQMASAISAVANGGKLFVPRLVDKIVDSDKNSIKVFEPQVRRENLVNSDNLIAVRKGMREAVTSGSAAALNDLPVKVAGKTGTAQVAGQARENAWFVGFAPYDDPKVALVIMLENAGEGSSYAVPVANQVFKYYFTR
ncbi:MAG: penicillin-binding protein 2 [bacterium]